MKSNRKLGIVLMIVFSLMLGACGKDNVIKENQSSKKTEDELNSKTEDISTNMNDLSGTIVITGSTSVEKILNDMIDEFTALHPEVSINYTGTGSSAGIADTLAGSNGIGVSSREVKAEEKTGDLLVEAFAYDGIAIIVNRNNQVKDISKENIAKIFSGEITNWNQIGGTDGEIMAVSREGSSGTRSAFEELIKLEDEGGLTQDATVVEGNGNAQTTVAGNENAIGYVSFSYIDSTVNALTIDGVEATAENAKDGSYILSRPFLLVFKESTLTPECKSFIEYAKSAEGQEFVTEHGGIRID